MAKLLKDNYTPLYIQKLSDAIKSSFTAFDEKSFLNSIFDENWKELELKARMRHIALALDKYLPFSYPQQLDILKPISKKFYSFEAMFFQDFVEVFGLEDFENSMQALEVFTIDSSSEFAIRKFILKDEERTMQQIKIWTQSTNEQIRRLASESCRPRLPWAIALEKFKKDPTKVLEIIELLKNDKSKYVMKSVANNLNDISKEHPEIVIKFVKNNLNAAKELDWICKHAARTLLKKGDKTLLALFGFNEAKHINLTHLKYDKKVNIGEDFTFSFQLQTKKELAKVRVEYAIEYLKSNGTYHKKVFMITQNEIKSSSKNFCKKQSFKDMSTRKHYEGKHYFSIIVNGEVKIRGAFTL
ncbi:DNA alkylation repair protein [Sulfurimonas sp.]